MGAGCRTAGVRWPAMAPARWRPRGARPRARRAAGDRGARGTCARGMRAARRRGVDGPRGCDGPRSVMAPPQRARRARRAGGVAIPASEAVHRTSCPAMAPRGWAPRARDGAGIATTGRRTARAATSTSSRSARRELGQERGGGTAAQRQRHVRRGHQARDCQRADGDGAAPPRWTATRRRRDSKRGLTHEGGRTKATPWAPGAGLQVCARETWSGREPGRWRRE